MVKFGDNAVRVVIFNISILKAKSNLVVKLICCISQTSWSLSIINKYIIYYHVYCVFGGRIDIIWPVLRVRYERFVLLTRYTQLLKENRRGLNFFKYSVDNYSIIITKEKKIERVSLPL